MGSSLSTPLTFTGVSTFSSDFQTILQRAVSIANVPVQQLQGQQSQLLAQKQLLTDLNGSVGSLANDVSALADLGTSKAISVVSSNSSIVSVAANGTTQPATHTITEITSVAKAASETSASGFATANSTSVTSGSSFELAIGSKTYNVPIASNNNNLNALRDAINNLGVGVTASVLNTGSGATPYYLSLSANATGQNAIQLRTTAGDATTNILTATNPGANASFKLDGILVTNPDNVISSVIDGVTFTILNTTASGASVTLSSSSDRSRLESALSNLVSDYNAVSGKGECSDRKSGWSIKRGLGDSPGQGCTAAIRQLSGRPEQQRQVAVRPWHQFGYDRRHVL
jgi:flagellar hook-associated protein 2